MGVTTTMQDWHSAINPDATASAAGRGRAFDDLLRQFKADPDCRVTVGVPLRTLSRWRIGGLADLVIEPQNAAALGRTLKRLSDSCLPRVVIGHGSNLLFDDAGLRGVIVRIGRKLSEMHIEGRRVWAQAGIWTPLFARRVGCSGLSGVEHAIGIPGTLGGLLVMNGGSQRKSVGSHVIAATCLDTEGRRDVLDRDACAFAYRTSALQKHGLVVVDAEFEFEARDAASIRSEMIGIMASRRQKFPLHLPNCGSVFLSDPGMYDVIGPPGKAIEESGLRGLRMGDAQIAPSHGNFIVNLGRASSNDVLALIGMIRQTIYDRTKYWMDCEVCYVTPEGAVIQAHLAQLRE